MAATSPCSASAIFAAGESGHHLLKIDGYSIVKTSHANGDGIKSRSFRAAGHTWHVDYYPNGLERQHADHIALYLALEDDVTAPVVARFSFSLLDRAGKPVPSYAQPQVCDFQANAWGYGEFIRTSDLEGSEHLSDDCFTVRCDITVVEAEVRTKDLPSTTAVSMVATESGHHLLKIDGYSHTKGVDNGTCIRSGSFRAGGHTWNMEYYPNGYFEEDAGNVSLYLELDEDVAEAVKARAVFTLLDGYGEPVSYYTLATRVHAFDLENCRFGYGCFITREDLEKSGYLKDDCFVVKCDIRTVPTIAAASPPSDLQRDMAGLLASEDDADVTFVVGDEAFAAHLCVLGARAPAFRRKLFGGPAQESGAASVVRIDDMEPRVFEAFLGFLYTDTLPEMEGDVVGMVHHLIAAADKYDMQKLRLACEEKLCEYINASTVASILELAEEQQYQGLKEACLDFLSSTANLRAAMATEDFERLSISSPSILGEIIAQLMEVTP